MRSKEIQAGPGSTILIPAKDGEIMEAIQAPKSHLPEVLGILVRGGIDRQPKQWPPKNPTSL